MPHPVAKPRVHALRRKSSPRRPRMVKQAIPTPRPRAANVEVAGNRANIARKKAPAKARPPQKVRPPIQKGRPKKGTVVPMAPRPVSRAGAVVQKRQAKPSRFIRRHQRTRGQSSTSRVNLTKIATLKGAGASRVLVMVACGPSVQEVPIEKLVGHNRIDTLVINKPEPRVWPSTFWSFCDNTQYARNKSAFENYDGILINSSAITIHHKKQIIIQSRMGKGWSKDLTQGYYIGRTTTYASMQVAAYMGYPRVYILGVDMGKVGDKLYRYGDGHNPDVADTNRMQRFAREAENFNHGASAMSESERNRFYFCSTYNQWPFVKQFQRRDQKVVVDEILEFADSLA